MSPFSAGAEEVVYHHRNVEVIDVPTANVIDHYGYHVSFRFYEGGNLQAKTYFGVFPRLNIGFGLDSEQFIGTHDTRLNKPSINVKFRIFDGKKFIPAFALGFDGQGFMYNRSIDEYEQREKGFYLAGSLEVLVPNSFLHFGVNRFDFSEGDSTRGFVGWSWVYEQIFGLLAEYDGIGNYHDRRINYGLRYFITPIFTVDVAGRYISESPSSDKHVTERIVRLGYTGSF